MSRSLLILALITLAVPAAALDDLLSDQVPSKRASVVIPPPATPETVRQGGDTILDAVMVTLPATETGTTVGYNDDYDEACPYPGSTSPDVVYTFVAPGDMQVDVDLFGSSYDTKVYVYDENLALVACNDDFYPDYVSKIEAMPVNDGGQYYVVIDGYGGDYGDYVVFIGEFIPTPPCEFECLDSTFQENEPPLENGYVDNWNGGCNTPDTEPFQTVYGSICGVSGWYLGADGSNSRDTDWFEIEVPYSGELVIDADAGELCWMFQLGPQDCDTVDIVQQLSIGPCQWGLMYIEAEPGSTVWLWVGPQDFVSPDGSDVYEFDYFFCYNGGCPDLATEEHSWSDVKSLFR